MLQVSSVRKAFSSVTAVDDVSFDVKKGEVHALLGPNGAGKSTLMRMLLGLIEPDSGTIEFNTTGGVSRFFPSRLTGYLPEDRGLYPDASVLRTLVHFAGLRGMSRSTATAAAREWLARLDLSEREAEPVKALSKGNQQKVQFITAVLHQPEFLVLDEPFSGLDPVNQNTFVELIAKLRDDGATVLLSAHQMSLVEQVADRIAVIKAGRLMLNGTMNEIRRDWTTGSRIVLHLTSSPSPESLSLEAAGARVSMLDPMTVEIVVAAGVPLSGILTGIIGRFSIRAIESRDVTLHDVYVDVIGSGVDPLQGGNQ